jgi:hypothetical protein
MWLGWLGFWAVGVSSLPLNYLVLPLWASYEAKHIQDDVIEKIECWLASWKG